METVVSVKVLRPYVLDVTFNDGSHREVDVESQLFGELFEPLREPDRFAEAAVDEVLGTVVWPNGADFSPEFLYASTANDGGHEESVRKFIDSDAEYERWLATYPDGFVVNAERRPRPGYLVLHRATCRRISEAPANGVMWTKDYIKLCSSSREPLAEWATNLGGTLRRCSFCKPGRKA